MWRLNPPVKFFLTVLKAASKLRSIIIAADFSPYPEGIKFTLIIEILQKRILKLPLASATAQKGRYLFTNFRWLQPLLRGADIFSHIAVGFSQRQAVVVKKGLQPYDRTKVLFYCLFLPAAKATGKLITLFSKGICKIHLLGG